jgi:hypothetical protein
MNQIDYFKRYTEEEKFRSHHVINHNISVILDYCEYSIGSEFNVNDKEKLKSKTKKKEAPKEFMEAFTTLSKEEKVDYYIRVIGYMRSFI